MKITPDARLWQAVLGAALHDAAKGTDTGWIGSRDFRVVCSLAGIDPEAVASRFDPERFLRLIRDGLRIAERVSDTAA